MVKAEPPLQNMRMGLALVCQYDNAINRVCLSVCASVCVSLGEKETVRPTTKAQLKRINNNCPDRSKRNTTHAYMYV